MDNLNELIKERKELIREINLFAEWTIQETDKVLKENNNDRYITK